MDVIPGGEETRGTTARVEAAVAGRVQGVGFRYRAREEAMVLGLAGEAVNLADGSVRVVAEGPRHAVEKLVAWLESGRTPGRVDSVGAVWQAPRGDVGGFRTG